MFNHHNFDPADLHIFSVKYNAIFYKKLSFKLGEDRSEAQPYLEMKIPEKYR